MKTDVVIVGGGPAGAASAMFLIREGIRPLILEMESFPRYHIGESLTGAGGKVLRDLGLTEEMYRRKHPCKQGVKVYGQSARAAPGSFRSRAAMRTGSSLIGTPGKCAAATLTR